MGAMPMMPMKELAHDVVHAIVVPGAIWFWNERRILKAVLEDHLERRKNTMSFQSVAEGVLLEIAHLVEGVFKHTAPVIEKAAADTAVAAAEQEVAADPRAQAIAETSLAFLKAAQDVKAAIQTPPTSTTAPVQEPS